MKMLPVQLSLNPPLSLWSDVLWRCPPAAPSQLAELKTQLPASLPSDPRLWSREDVALFLRFCEREFDLPKLDYELFQMNGKALCLLTRADFGHRCPGAGDVLHNVLQMLIIESHMMQWHLPNSPVTPTSRYPLSPHSHPPTPTWPPIAPPEGSGFQNPHLHHFMAPNSVTLSPPPSVDSQASSPPQNSEQLPSSSNNGASLTCNPSSSSSSSSASSSVSTSIGGGNMFIPLKTTSTSSSNHSDSDDESVSDNMNAVKGPSTSSGLKYNTSPPTTPILKDMPQSFSMASNFVNSWNQNQPQLQGQKLQLPSGSGGSVSAPTTPSFMQPVKREFFPENSEPNTNGRLLWDFLQQLLNDRNQKYSDLIAWKCRDTGVFKIVDPAGLAKLWGIQKNHLSMNYDKMSRALRYYYRVNILRKVQGERHCYQFLRNPTELKNIKNISLLRQSVASSASTTSTNNATTNSSSNTNSSYQQNVNNSTPSLSSASAAAAAMAVANASSPSTTNKSLQSTNWQLPQQISVSGQTNSVPPQSPQRPASRNSGNHPMNLPTVAAVAAAAAAAAYGPPPTSPLFMHAYHYLSSNPSTATPNSPILSSTGDDKFQFHPMKNENSTTSTSLDGSEDMKPTDLSLGSSNYSTNNNSEKRSYTEDSYPMMRNAGDGLTTVKLSRYSDNNDGFKTPHTQSQIQTNSDQQHESSKMTQGDKKSHNTNLPMESDPANDEESNSYNNLMPTDLRK